MPTTSTLGWRDHSPQAEDAGPRPSRKRCCFGAFLCHPGVCLPSTQTAPRTLARDLGKKVWAVLLFPGLWELSDLPVRASLGPEAAVARFCAYLLGVGWERSYLALGAL